MKKIIMILGMVSVLVSCKNTDQQGVVADDVQKVTIDSKGMYSKEFNINENDVLLLNFIKQ